MDKEFKKLKTEYIKEHNEQIDKDNKIIEKFNESHKGPYYKIKLELDEIIVQTYTLFINKREKLTNRYDYLRTTSVNIRLINITDSPWYTAFFNGITLDELPTLPTSDIFHKRMVEHDLHTTLEEAKETKLNWYIDRCKKSIKEIKETITTGGDHDES